MKISPDGKLLHVFEIAAGDGTTNVAFSEGEKELYVTVVKDLRFGYLIAKSAFTPSARLLLRKIKIVEGGSK